MALSKEVENDYKASLMDLNFNSKPLINMLTMVAEDHEQHAPAIVKVIEDHLNKV
jgi:pre-mRNA cleavage complex 2 protein Pcf11